MLSVASAVVSSGRGVRAIFRIQGDHPSTAAFVAGRPARAKPAPVSGSAAEGDFAGLARDILLQPDRIHPPGAVKAPWVLTDLASVVRQ
jgi:hypothetical protein